MLAAASGNRGACHVVATPAPNLWMVDARQTLIPACWELFDPGEWLYSDNCILDADRHRR